MISKHIQRIQALESLAKEKEMLRRSRAPFVLYRPWSFSLDQHYLIYYPEGMYQQPQECGPLNFAELRDRLRTYPESTRLEISMNWCAEWLFAFYHYSDCSKLYTQEQHRNFIEKELKEKPELNYLVEDAEMVNKMLKIPQKITVRVKDYLGAIKEV